MKSLKDLITSRTAKVLGTAALAVMPYFANAQNDVNPNGVPTEDIMNQFQKSDIHYDYLGKEDYEYYGSGDVDLDGEPGTPQDAQAIRDGLVNDMADVNFDNEVNDLDADLIDSESVIGSDYMNPNHTIEEKKEMIYNLYNNVLIPSHETVQDANDRTIMAPRPGWTCGDYVTQAIHDLKGFSENEDFITRLWNSGDAESFNYDNNARFNIQVNKSGSRTISGVAHAILAFPVGEDLRQIENWYFLDAQTGKEANPGSDFNVYSPVDGSVNNSNYIEWVGTSETLGPWTNGQTNAESIIKFWLNSDESVITSNEKEAYNFTRPIVDTVEDIGTGSFNYLASEKKDMTVYDQGNTLKVNFYSDKNEKVIFQNVDLATGRVVSTLERELMAGENIVSIPDASGNSSSVNALVATGEDGYRQTTKYVNVK